jgi:hypothetical protein
MHTNIIALPTCLLAHSNTYLPIYTGTHPPTHSLSHSLLTIPPLAAPLPLHPASGLESALGRLRELEAEQQQLEARLNDLQEENLELSTEVCACVCGGGGRIRRGSLRP